VTSARPAPINDDHGDQFPGAVPAAAPAASPVDGAQHRMVRMHAAYLHKANSLVEAGRDGLAHELSATFVEETSAAPAGTHDDAAHPRRAAGRRTPTRTSSGRPPGQADTRLGRMGRLTRKSLDRFDRYTLEVFNPGAPYRPRDDRSV
jgi:hypothetical protein